MAFSLRWQVTSPMLTEQTMMLDTVAIIPARGGSKGITRKNLAIVAGLPLVARAIRACQVAGIERVIVSTDDSEIKSVALHFGAEVVDRPAGLCTDSSVSEEAIEHVLLSLGIHHGVCAFVQCTSPLLFPSEIEKCVALARSGKSAFTVVPCANTFWCKDRPMLSGPRIPRQLAEPVYQETGGCYAFPVAKFFSGATRTRFPTQIAMVESRYAIDIDTEDDLIAANALAATDPIMPEDMKLRLARVRHVVLDFDGVLTDGAIYTDDNGVSSVRCCKYDSVALADLVSSGVRCHVLTHEQSQHVLHRCAKMGFDKRDIHVVTSDKLNWLRDMYYTQHVLYVGDSKHDAGCMLACGISAAPCDAETSALDAAQIILETRGGHGVLREIADMIISAKSRASQ